LEGLAVTIAGHRVTVWDIGPQAPVQPAKPVPPAADPEGLDADYNHALRDWRELALPAYQRAAAAYAQDRKAWLAEHGGVVEISMMTVGAREAIERGGGRYVDKLPDGMEPGPKSGINRVVH
jgi:hypothetical protein